MKPAAPEITYRNTNPSDTPYIHLAGTVRLHAESDVAGNQSAFMSLLLFPYVCSCGITT